MSEAESIDAYVSEAAHRFDIPAAWIRDVIQVESGYDENAVSQKGALGLMQLMPATYAAMRLRYSLDTDPFQPHDNIIAGTAYLREMLDCYGTPGFLAAYNAGPTRYDSHLATGAPLPAETRTYVARLLLMLAGEQLAAAKTGTRTVFDRRSWMHAPLFATVLRNTDPRASGISTSAIPLSLHAPSDSRPESSSIADLVPPESASGSLFVRLRGDSATQ